MRGILILFLGFFVVTAIAFVTMFASVQSGRGNISIITPLPELLFSIPEVLGSDIWKPSPAGVDGKQIQAPDITARAALSYDIKTEKMLYSLNEKKTLPMASLTKIMTAIVALEGDVLHSKYTVSKSAASVGENAMGLSEGEILTLEELLYGLLLPSGNDAAEVIAQGSPYGRENFVFIMNKKAEDLGMSHTRFTNPSGLEGDGAQYTTAEDLLILTRYAMKNKEFAKIVGTYEYELQATEDHKYFLLYNETNLLTTYPGVRGVKTGFTFEAGLCLVTFLEHKDHTIIAILLNSENRRQEMKDLLDYSLRLLGQTPPQHI